jgi:hypothetical protein
MDDITTVESLSKLMQLSVSPAVLISAVGLLLLSVTNRLGRAIDRSRLTVKELDHNSDNLNSEVARSEMRCQLGILLRRASLLRYSVSLLVGSIFFSCLMILFLYFKSFGGMHMESLVIALFFLNLMSLLGSMSFLLADIYLSLRALRIEVSRHLN